MPALIVGLGNPGSTYANTRHNVGFRCVDELARRHHLQWAKPRLKAAQARGVIAGRDVVLAKPQTFMNLSGTSVVQLVKWYQVPLTEVLIIHDDMDIPFGHLRLRATGSAGGQNGLASVLQQLRTNDVARLKIGISRPRWGDPKEYVLTRFSKEQETDLHVVLAHAADAAELWLAEGLIAAMNRYNGAVISEQPTS